jgi:hypothetical protein
MWIPGVQTQFQPDEGSFASIEIYINLRECAQAHLLHQLVHSNFAFRGYNCFSTTLILHFIFSARLGFPSFSHTVILCFTLKPLVLSTMTRQAHQQSNDMKNVLPFAVFISSVAAVTSMATVPRSELMNLSSFSTLTRA